MRTPDRVVHLMTREGATVFGHGGDDRAGWVVYQRGDVVTAECWDETRTVARSALAAEVEAAKFDLKDELRQEAEEEMRARKI